MDNTDNKFVNYDEKIKGIVLKFLPEDKFEVFLFGSRVTDDNQKWSDYDIGILPKGSAVFSASLKYDILDELDKEKIPFMVDLVDFSKVDSDFKKLALRKKAIWQI